MSLILSSPRTSSAFWNSSFQNLVSKISDFFAEVQFPYSRTSAFPMTTCIDFHQNSVLPFLKSAQATTESGLKIFCSIWRKFSEKPFLISEKFSEFSPFDFQNCFWCQIFITLSLKFFQSLIVFWELTSFFAKFFREDFQNFYLPALKSWFCSPRIKYPGNIRGRHLPLIFSTCVIVKCISIPPCFICSRFPDSSTYFHTNYVWAFRC